MCKWLKVLDEDGNPTQYWDEYKEWTKSLATHRLWWIILVHMLELWPQ